MSLFAVVEEGSEADEQVRRAGEESLGGVASPPLLRDRKSRGLLRADGRGGGDGSGIDLPSDAQVSAEPSFGSAGRSLGVDGATERRGASAVRVGLFDAGGDGGSSDAGGIQPTHHSGSDAAIDLRRAEFRFADVGNFRPEGQVDLAPGGERAKATANLAALRLLKALEAEGRAARPEDQAVLARWSGWGALPGIFDDSNEKWTKERAELRTLLTPQEWESARRTTLNAHYTDAGVVRAIWSGVQSLGFDGGAVLEPGCGAGNFMGLAPDLPLSWVGVELDLLTGRVAQDLYPTADIRIEGFENSRLQRDSFDLAIGNVPFGNFHLVDPEHNRARHNIHNHFIIKSLDLVRPGGLVAVVTSRYTLDAANASARRDMADRADLVGAIRLPQGAFQAAAGTGVICDLVVFRKREQHETPQSSAWLERANVETSTGVASINAWFAAHPQFVVGEMRVGSGQYRDDDLNVVMPEQFPARLEDAVDGLVRSTTLSYSARPHTVPAVVPPIRPSVSFKEGSIHRSESGFVVVSGGAFKPFEVRPAKDADELSRLLDLRDTVTELLDVQATSRDDAAFRELQVKLTTSYERYVERYGPINRYRLARTGRVDPETGVDRWRKIRPSLGGFRSDPDCPTVLALEHYDDETGQVQKAAIFSQRVVAPRELAVSADNPADALALCLDERGGPDLERIAELLGSAPEEARAVLGSLVWDDPATGDLVTADKYLSGDVRAKLATAREAAESDPRWQANVEALRTVVPADLGPAEIDVRPGATWIPTSDVAAFVAEVLDAPGAIVEYEAQLGQWAITAPAGARNSVTMRSEWGTERVSAVDLLVSASNQSVPTVYDMIDEKRVLNADQTLAARAKQEELVERFSQWIWEDDDRAARLSERYNELFNSVVLPSYDGSHLSLPGLAVGFTPHQHQRDAVWRIVSEPATLLAHSVGAGKTATMVMSAMELRRLGMANKPAIVVPNHMLEQFAREAKQLYPQANLLIAGKDEVDKENRKAFVARCATGDWDAVIITHSAFEKIPVSMTTRQTFVDAELSGLRSAFEQSRDGDDKPITVKHLEKLMVRRETGLKELMNESSKDDGVSIEAAGIDYLFVDEAHLYKNLAVASRIQGVASAGSQRAEDLHLKLAYLRQQGGRVATLATATPVANSISELYVMQSYLQPEKLATAGLQHFDGWAANFGATVTALELAPDGSGYRMNTRFAKFRNVPDLLTMFSAVADVRTADDLNLKVPDLLGGKAETVVVPSTETLTDYVMSLVDRAEAVRRRQVRPDEDNMLAITGDGRRAALDLRLVGQPAASPTKAQIVAERVAEIYHAHKADIFDEQGTGVGVGRPGALQLVFCDMGTPKPGEWSVYDELREQLVARQVPLGAVKFVHEANDDRKKAELFAACRDGRVAVLVGSTEKMGVGTNVQARAVALHHMDCPWRPADIEQREGRILRQGNQNAQVAILRYATEGSFDVFMWQTVERKSTFINQVTRGRVDVREIDDVGESTLSYAEVKALASGNPLIMEQAGVGAEIAKLSRLRDAHRRDQQRLMRTRDFAAGVASQRAGIVEQCDRAISRRIDTQGPAFVMVVDGTKFHDRKEAGKALQAHLWDRVLNRRDNAAIVGEVAGFDIVAKVHRDVGIEVGVTIQETPIQVTYSRDDLRAGDPVGVVRRLERPIQSIERTRDEAAEEMAKALDEIRHAENRIGTVFEHESRLVELHVRKAEIEAALTPQHESAAGVEPIVPETFKVRPKTATKHRDAIVEHEKSVGSQRPAEENKDRDR